MSRPYILGNGIWVTTVGFLQLFEDIEVRNYTERYGKEFTRRLKVDVSLDTKERIQHKLLAGGHKQLEQADTRLPRMSVQINNITPDTSRYAGKNTKRVLQRGTNEETGQNLLSYDVQPFPINIEYNVSIWAKYFEHYAQILENIIPYFDPYVTVGVKERNFNIERELKVEMTGVGQSSTFEMEGATQRLIRGDMTFNVQTTAYKYLNDQVSELIEKTQVHVIDIQSPISSETITICASEGDFLG